MRLKSEKCWYCLHREAQGQFRAVETYSKKEYTVTEQAHIKSKQSAYILVGNETIGALLMFLFVSLSSIQSVRRECVIGEMRVGGCSAFCESFNNSKKQIAILATSMRHDV